MIIPEIRRSEGIPPGRHVARSSPTPDVRPRLGKGAESREVDFGVNLRRIRGAMSEHLADLAHGCTPSEHPRRQGVAEYVGTLGRGLETGAFQGAPNNGRDG